MSSIIPHQTGTSEMYSTFLVILKVRGDAIQLWSRSEMQSIYKANSFRIFCQNLHARSDQANPDIKYFALKSKTSMNVAEKSAFKHQNISGQPVNPDDLVLFMTSPIESSRKASYAINVGVTTLSTSLEDLNKDDCRKIGTAYLYLDPKFSSQGIQRMQIMGTHNSSPVGHMQVEYLIVTNPNAYGVSVAKPSWTSPLIQLDAGHRGAGSGCRADLPGSITENTVASFNYAARHGADMCELDVMCTADGVPVVYHNYTLDTSKTGAPQIDELTLDELRELKNMTLHDTNCKHTKDNQNSLVLQKNSTPFPTLKEVLLNVDHSCALNIELKWPQLLPNGKNEASYFREINDFVDRILDCIYNHSNGRAIMLSTLNANIAIMLRLKQTQYPVLFLTTGDSQRFNDPVTKTIQNAIHFAQAFDMAGINPNAAMLTEYMVRNAQDRGLLVYAWGNKINSAQAIKELKQTGLNGLIYDKIDLIKPQE